MHTNGVESICASGDLWVDLPIQQKNGVEEIDWAPLIPVLLDESQSSASRSMVFHNSIARSVLVMALKMRDQFAINVVGFSGGVFQNKRLVEKAKALLENNGFVVFVSSQVTCNDAGISFGQLIEWGYSAEC